MLQFKSRFPREVLLCRVCFCLHLNDAFLPPTVISFTWKALAVINQLKCPPPSLQVGEFYEAIGIDACVLVEYAGLNPFGGLRSDSVPRAGCPVVVLK